MLFHDILMRAYKASIGVAMNIQKNTISVFAQIASKISDRIIENLVHKHSIQTHPLNADSHVIAIYNKYLALFHA